MWVLYMYKYTHTHICIYINMYVSFFFFEWKRGLFWVSVWHLNLNVNLETASEQETKILHKHINCSIPIVKCSVENRTLRDWYKIYQKHSWCMRALLSTSIVMCYVNPYAYVQNGIIWHRLGSKLCKHVRQALMLLWPVCLSLCLWAVSSSCHYLCAISLPQKYLLPPRWKSGSRFLKLCLARMGIICHLAAGSFSR